MCFMFLEDVEEIICLDAQMAEDESGHAEGDMFGGSLHEIGQVGKRIILIE